MKKFLFLVIVALLSPASAQIVNSWIKSTSGNWEDQTAWSLSTPPSPGQTVMLTNQGWKAVAIGTSTAQNFPNSMTVSNLTVRGAWDTENVLLLNYVGTAVPLTVLNGVTLQDDGRIVNFNSGLNVQSGTFLITNSTMIQDGGFVRVTNTLMYLQNAEYDLTNGVFEAGQVGLGTSVAARINQYGGAAVITNLWFGAGRSGSGGVYTLYNGYLTLPNGLSVVAGGGASSAYLQEGGSNQTTQV